MCVMAAVPHGKGWSRDEVVGWVGNYRWMDRDDSSSCKDWFGTVRVEVEAVGAGAATGDGMMTGVVIVGAEWDGANKSRGWSGAAHGAADGAGSSGGGSWSAWSTALRSATSKLQDDVSHWRCQQMVQGRLTLYSGRRRDSLSGFGCNNNPASESSDWSRRPMIPTTSIQPPTQWTQILGSQTHTTKK